jgi:hypothetical protein
VHYVGETSKEMEEDMVQTALLQLEEKQESEASLEFLAVSIVDELLDIYNDYKILYEFFEDPEYKDMMDFILESLHEHFG